PLPSRRECSWRPRRWHFRAIPSPPTLAARQLRPLRFYSPPPPAICVSDSFSGFLLFLDGDSELVELIFVHGRWRLRHQILRGGGFGESDDFADGFFTR